MSNEAIDQILEEMNSGALNPTKPRLDSTKPQPGLTTNQSSSIPSRPSSIPGQPSSIPVTRQLTPLFEQALQAKGDLEVLVATGKSKDFLGKQLTFNDVDYMSEKDILKYHRIYQSALAVRVNDTFSKVAVKTYCTLTKWVLPIQDEGKLYHDLRNDYILMSELDKWTGWLSLKMGGLMAVASTSLITMANCASPFSQNINGADDSIHASSHEGHNTGSTGDAGIEG